MQKEIFLIVAIFISTSALFAGISPPEPHIAKTYKVGIFSDNDYCIKEITNRLTIDGYNVDELDSSDKPWNLVDGRNLDFLLFRKDSQLYFLVRKGPIYKTYNLDDIRERCLLPVYYIWENTKNKNPLNSDETADAETSKHATLYSGFESDNESIEDLKSQLRLEPENWVINFKLAKIYGAKNDYSQFQTHLKKASELNPFNCEITIAMGNYLLQQKLYSEAIREYSNCLSDPDNSDIANFNIGLVYELTGQNDKALKSFTEVHEQSHLIGRAKERIFIIEDKISKTTKRYIQTGLIVVVLLGALFLFLFWKKRTNSEEHTNLKELIAKGNLDKAFSVMQQTENKDGQSTSLDNQLAILKNRWNRIKEEENLGLVTHSDAKIEKNRIIHSFLQLSQEG